MTGKRHKLIIAAIGIILVALCGCQKKLNSEDANTAAQKFSADFSSKADIRYRETGSKITLERKGEQFNLTFCGGDELDGMKFTLNTSDGSGTAEFNGVSVPFESGENMPVKVLADVFNVIKDSQQLRVWESDGCLIAAQNKSDNFFVAADMKSGEIISISVPVLDLEINFESFKYI